MTDRTSFRDWFRDRQRDFDALVLDIDGVLVRGREAVPGAAALLRELRDHGVAFSLLTNDGSHSAVERAAKLRSAGVPVQAAEITSCSEGLEEIVQDHALAGKSAFVMGKLGNPCYAEAAGLRPTRDLTALPDCAAVIVGEDDYDWEPVFNAVINALIRNPDRLFIVPNPDEYYPAENGCIRIAAGGQARFIQRVTAAYGVNVDPLYLGKPYQPIFRHSHRLLEQRLGRAIAPERVFLLGDSLEADIAGAQRFGYRAGLVLTGATRPDRAANTTVKPEIVFHTL